MKKRQILALALGGTLVVPLISGCNSNPGIASSSQAASDYSTSGSTDVEGKTYTLREYDSSTPTNWCPVSWEMSNDTYIPGYCEMGFVDLAKKADSTDYEFVYEMASDIKDVTADYLKDTTFTTKWGLASDATEQVYEIDLNKAAKFQDGTAINADTYVACMDGITEDAFNAMVDWQTKNNAQIIYPMVDDTLLEISSQASNANIFFQTKSGYPIDQNGAKITELAKLGEMKDAYLRDSSGTVQFWEAKASNQRYIRVWYWNYYRYMYYGKMVELATSEELFRHPLHPYTKSLISAIPLPDPHYEAHRKRILYNAAVAHDYSTDKPSFQEILPGHFVYCNQAEFAKYQEEIKTLDAALAVKKG